MNGRATEKRASERKRRRRRLVCYIYPAIHSRGKAQAKHPAGNLNEIRDFRFELSRSLILLLALFSTSRSKRAAKSFIHYFSLQLNNILSPQSTRRLSDEINAKIAKQISKVIHSFIRLVLFCI